MNDFRSLRLVPLQRLPAYLWARIYERRLSAIAAKGNVCAARWAGYSWDYRAESSGR